MLNFILIPTTMFLTVAAFADSYLALLGALVCGLAFYALNLIEIFGMLPRLNLVRLIAASCGIFYYFGGALMAMTELSAGDNIYQHMFQTWRDYSVPHMAAAALLVMLCTALTLQVGRAVKPETLSFIRTAEQFYGDKVIVHRDWALGALFVSAVGVMTAYLLATGKLTVNNGTFMFAGERESSELIVLANWLAPASTLLIVYLLTARGAALASRAFVFLMSLPIIMADFTFGRRYVIAAAAITFVGLSVFRGLRLKLRHWVWLVGGGAALFLAISGPFLALRAAQNHSRSVGVVDYLSAPMSAGPSVSLSDMLSLSANRADILGELSQFVANIPPTSMRLGTGLLSEAAVLAPHALWPTKQYFLTWKMLTDATICISAGLPPQDIASSFVLYSYAEFGWLGPIWYCLITIAFVVIASAFARISGSYIHYLLTLSMLMIYALVPDNTWGGEMLQELRFAIGLAILFSTLQVLVRARGMNQPKVLRMSPGAQRRLEAQMGSLRD